LGSNSEKPLVSVLMTAYNRERYIEEAIESVLSSTYENFELIIVDDCSKDTTVEIIKCYKAKDARIKFYLNEKNLGDYANRNKAAGYASGMYIKYCDSDDKLYQWTLDYCVAMMEEYPDAGMGILNLNKNIQQKYMTSAEAIHFNFFQTEILAIGPSGTILRSDAFKKAGFFKPDYGAASDMYFNIKMASLFPVVLLNKDFFFYREHEGQEFQNKYGYLCYSYKYLHDALQLPEITLTAGQKNKLLTQAKRSFVKRFFKYLKVTGNLGKAQKAFNISGIGIAGFLRGIFQ
jgi:glycosyltransferase involved in cell wall biosynthesis